MKTKLNGVILGSDAVLEGNNDLKMQQQNSEPAANNYKEDALQQKDNLSKTTNVNTMNSWHASAIKAMSPSSTARSRQSNKPYSLAMNSGMDIVGSPE